MNTENFDEGLTRVADKISTKEEIEEKAYLDESSKLCREYFKKRGLSYSDLTKNNLKKLREFIQEETYPLLADKSYHMIRELRMDDLIKIVYKNKRKKDIIEEAYLFINGSYFKLREAVSFNGDNQFIGFCGWADGCNRIPIIRGFVKWCDWMEKEKKE